MTLTPSAIAARLVEAAEQHSDGTGEDHVPGDMQNALTVALEMLSPARLISFLEHPQIVEQLALGGDTEPPPPRRIAFNTLRSYTKHGQRIAAQAIDGGVYMVDVDRGLTYFFPGVQLTQGSIMRAYDTNEPPARHVPPSVDTNNKETPGTWEEKIAAARKLREELEEMARQVEPFTHPDSKHEK